MSSHRIHPDSHTHGLADGCERCDEHAEHPFESLDNKNIGALIERVRNHHKPRSDNEAAAMYEVQKALEICQRINQIGGSA